MSSTPTFRGYERRTIPTANVAVGDLIYYPGAGMLVPIVAVNRDAETTRLNVAYEVLGRGRRGVVRRKTDGRSVIHVTLE